MSSYLVDTHPLLWWLGQPKKLSAKAARALDDPDSILHVPTMAILEVKYLVEIGRVRVRISDVLAFLKSRDNMHLLPFDELVLHEATRNMDTRDPFDRIIVGTAQAYELKLISKDRWIHENYPKLSFW